MGEALVCDHANENYWAALSWGTVYWAVQGGSNFYSETNSVGATQHFLTNHETSSEQKNQGFLTSKLIIGP